jgi:hypothetical protein
MRRNLLLPVLGLVLLALAACSDRTADVVEKAEGVSSKTELRDVLGSPDKLDKVGPVERWTYETSDGSVTFVITGDTVVLDAARTED